MKELIQTLKKKYKDNNYEFFDGGSPYNVNIFGLRNPSRKSNKFDDSLYCVFRNDSLDWVIKQWRITTDPGTTYLEYPMNWAGTAILVPGQYKGAYKIDKHQGRYEALCQRLGTVKVFRDRDKDNMLDMNYPSIQTGMFGINIHQAGKNSRQVDRWSAGCQVFKRSSDFKEFMDIIKTSAKIYGNRFTYTLFEDSY